MNRLAFLDKSIPVEIGDIFFMPQSLFSMSKQDGIVKITGIGSHNWSNQLSIEWIQNPWDKTMEDDKISTYWLRRPGVKFVINEK
jgi:hypothetical protein